MSTQATESTAAEASPQSTAELAARTGHSERWTSCSRTPGS
jgi:hypothetical protein